jgi:hypothetical protein
LSGHHKQWKQWKQCKQWKEDAPFDFAQDEHRISTGKKRELGAIGGAVSKDEAPRGTRRSSFRHLEEGQEQGNEEERMGVRRDASRTVLGDRETGIRPL